MLIVLSLACSVLLCSAGRTGQKAFPGPVSEEGLTGV